MDTNTQTIAIPVSPISLGIEVLWLNGKSTGFELRQSQVEPQLTSYENLRNSLNLSNWDNESDYFSGSKFSKELKAGL